MSDFVIVTVPKPRAPATAWVQEWDVYGPFETYEQATEAMERMPTSQSWTRRVVKLVPIGKGARA